MQAESAPVLEGRAAEAPAPATMPWPSRGWAWLLGALLLIQMAGHLGFRSPYLYYTEGQYGLERGTYGRYLGPSGEIIHFDAVNYWAVEYLFSGKYRGDPLATISRPAYPFLAALLDNYLHPVHAGWVINFLAWWAAAIFAYALARGLGGGGASAQAFSLLIAASPAFISMAGQPMGYALGYAVHIVFLACLACWLPAPRPAAAAGAFAFLLVLGDFTYEILGPMCLLPFLALAPSGLGWRLTAACLGAFLAAKAGWDVFAVRGALDTAKGSGLDTKLHEFTGARAFTWATLPVVAGNLALGSLISGFFLIPAIGWIGLFFQRGARLRFFLWGMAAVTAPLFYMGIIGETIGNYAFYKEGRIVAYCYPFFALAAVLGLESLATRLRLRSKAAAWLLAPVVVLHLVLANADWAGGKSLYYMLHHREGYKPGEILGR